MTSSFFKNPSTKNSSQTRGTAFGPTQNFRNPAKKSFSQYSNNNFIDLGWVSGFSEQLEKFSKIGTVAYQILALSLLTIGLVLAFQNFSSIKTSENIVVISKAQIAKVEEKRIWTDTDSIDKTQTKYNFKISTAQIAQVTAVNSECQNKVVEAETQFSSDQSEKCNSKTESKTGSLTKKDKQTKTPTKTIKVAAGENLSSIAMTHKVNVGDIIALNDLKSNKLKLGQTLVVPIAK